MSKEILKELKESGFTRRDFLKGLGIAAGASALAPYISFAQEEIKVGFFSPLTGPAAADGKSALEGAKLAVDLVNAAGGINGRKLVLLNDDDALKADQAVAIARKFIGQGIVAAISGSYSGPTRAAAPVFQQAGIPMISAYAVHPEITKAGDLIFRVGTRAEVQGHAGAYLAVRELGMDTIALLIMKNDFGVALATSFKAKVVALGAQIVYEKEYRFPGETEFRPYLNDIKAINPEGVYATAYLNEAAHIVSQAEELGVRSLIIGQEGYDSPKFIELSKGNSANRTILTTDLNRDSPRKVVQDFLREYQARTGIPADMVGASAYDAVQVLAYALKRGTKAEEIKKAIMGLKDFQEAVTGPFLRYTPGREVVRPITPQIVRNKAFHFFMEFTEEEIITPPE